MQNIDTLKSLTQTTYDSVEGYRKAVDKAESTALKRALERRLNSREQTLATLNSLLATNGEDRIATTSMSASAHQTFMTIADAFENGDEAAVERVEEGEDYIAGQFRDALNDNKLESSVRTVIEQAAQEVCEGERFSDMLEEQYA
ncbi:MAG: PA2169 family four-helix-bundle protein [Erythrobacter sp.]